AHHPGNPRANIEGESPLQGKGIRSEMLRLSISEMLRLSISRLLFLAKADADRPRPDVGAARAPPGTPPRRGDRPRRRWGRATRHAIGARSCCECAACRPLSFHRNGA